MDFYLLGRKIRNLRLSQHLSQACLAERIDVSTNYIGQIERGDRKPSLETLVELCNVLGTSMDYILSDSLQAEEDQITQDILFKLSTFSLEEKKFIYHVINNFLQMKESIYPPSS